MNDGLLLRAVDACQRAVEDRAVLIGSVEVQLLVEELERHPQEVHPICFGVGEAGANRKSRAPKRASWRTDTHVTQRHTHTHTTHTHTQTHTHTHTHTHTTHTTHTLFLSLSLSPNLKSPWVREQRDREQKSESSAQGRCWVRK
jgi:hypothetical protein